MSTPASDLQGRVALVTGGLRGIGLAIADKLQVLGCVVYCTDIEPDDKAAALLGAAADRLNYIQADVSSEEDWQAAIAQIKDAHGRLDILVNNAGTDCVSPVEELKLEDWRRIMAINVDGVFLGVKTAAPLLEASGAQTPAGSSIINISSIMGKVGYPDTSAYNAGKGAVKLFTKAVAIEFASKRKPIRVNSVHPGFIRTPLFDAGMQRLVDEGAAGSIDDLVDMLSQATPNGRLGTVEEIAEAVAFLAGDGSAYMTGAEMVVDGGWTAQ
ncbi:MAG: SDR family NAD(P)-dependent oxidoreductase [Parvibaculales bacterium]